MRLLHDQDKLTNRVLDYTIEDVIGNSIEKTVSMSYEDETFKRQD